jgi:hypothetical protein
LPARVVVYYVPAMALVADGTYPVMRALARSF